MKISWEQSKGNLRLTINYTKPSETGGMASGCSTTYGMNLNKGYNHAYNACVRAAKQDFHLPDLNLLPDAVPIETPKTFAGMTKAAWLLVIVWWCLIIPLMVWGAVESMPYVIKYHHAASVWMVEVLNSWGLNVCIIE